MYWEGAAAELPLRLDEEGTLLFTLERQGRRVEVRRKVYMTLLSEASAGEGGAVSVGTARQRL